MILALIPCIHSLRPSVLLESSCWSIHTAYLISLLWLAVANLCVPHVHSLYLMCALFFVNGLSGGTIQAGTLSLRHTPAAGDRH